MALEDFTTYTEDDPNGRIGVAANFLDVNNLQGNDVGRVYDDKGVANFGDYEHLIFLKYQGRLNNGQHAIDLCANVVDDAYTIYYDATANGDGLGIRAGYSSAPNYYFYLTDFGNKNNDLDNIVISISVAYYLTIKRLGTTATCKIYSDAARTILIDTMTITCKTTTYRYVYAVNNWASGVATNKISSDIRDLDLQEGVVDVSAGIKLWSSIADIELVKDDTSPVKIRTPAVTIGVELVATSDGDASPIRIRVDNATTKAFKKKV